MQLITFADNAGQVHYGCDLGERVIQLDQALRVVAPFSARDGFSEVPATMIEFLAADAVALQSARQALELVDSGSDLLDSAVLPKREVQILAPVPSPSKIVAIGRNYRDHAAEAALTLPKIPRIFAKFPSIVIGDGAVIVKPRATERLDWEVELAVVIGRTASRVSEETALEYVVGYTLLNDVSARDIQFSEPEQLTLAKNYRSFAPMGPSVVTKDELPDPANIRLKTWVNGELMQDGSTRDLIFSVRQLVSFVSGVLDLVPGDLIATGTPSGVGYFRDPPRFLSDGDVVTMDLAGMCSLTNRVQDER